MTLSDGTAKKRAHMPEGTNAIIGARSLDASHKRLAAMLRPGLSVLDVGCGNGAITVGMAEKVRPDGRVVGVDVNPRLVDEAKKLYGHIAELSFHARDAYDLGYDSAFDITTAARVLQWLADPADVLDQMIRATVRGGKVVILDYNHERLHWDPAPPDAATKFYQAFLHWRAGAGMDNTIADNVAAMFRQAGMHNVTVTQQHEAVRRGDSHFEQSVGIWAAVMASRGKQMVADGFITESERAAAELAYRQWAQEAAESQFMYLLAVEGTKP